MAITTTFEKYGVPISLSVAKAASSKSRVRKGLAYPFIDILSKTVTGGFIKAASSQGDYITAATGTTLVRNNLRQLLLTQKGERIMLPDYGLDMKRFLFEPLDETLFFLIRKEISLNIEKFFPLASILSISVVSDEKSLESSQLVIGLTLQLKDESLNVFDIEVTVR